MILKAIKRFMRLFGERYIYCDSEQARFDAEHRDDMIEAFSAIMDLLDSL